MLRWFLGGGNIKSTKRLCAHGRSERRHIPEAWIVNYSSASGAGAGRRALVTIFEQIPGGVNLHNNSGGYKAVADSHYARAPPPPAQLPPRSSRHTAPEYLYVITHTNYGVKSTALSLAIVMNDRSEFSYGLFMKSMKWWITYNFWNRGMRSILIHTDRIVVPVVNNNYRTSITVHLDLIG